MTKLSPRGGCANWKAASATWSGYWAQTMEVEILREALSTAQE